MMDLHKKGHQSFLGANFRVWVYGTTKNVYMSFPKLWSKTLAENRNEYRSNNFRR